MCGWGDNQIKYYLMGNPIVWWGGTASLIISVLVFLVYLFRQQRKYVDMDSREWDHFLYAGKIAFFGWFLHYAPFLFMGRVTYIHHYLPTLYFAILMFAHMMDHFFFTSRRYTDKTKHMIFGFTSFTIFAVFWWFRAVAWGIEGPIREYHGRGWRKSWNLYDL